MKKRLVIIGAGDFQNRLILKAKELGYETYVFSWEHDAIGKNNADYFYPISITEKEAILKQCQIIKPCGVCSIASDLAAITVNYIAENLGLPGNKVKYTEMQTNKYQMRRVLQYAGISCPKFVLADKDFSVKKLADFRFPVIVKPTDRSGSRAITKCETSDEIKSAIKNACDVSFEKKAIVEEFIDGHEYSMETISYNGKHYYLATTKKFTTNAPHFIETAHIQPSDLDKITNDKAIQTVFKALTALHIENSAGHSEFRVDKDGNIHIIEVGARMGGDCIGSDLVYLSTGNDFMKMVIDVACGKMPEIISCISPKYVQIKFLFTQQDINDLERIKIETPEKIYRISDIDMNNIGNITDSSTRLGYYIIII